MLSVLYEYYDKVFCSAVVLHAFTFWLSVTQMAVFREDELQQNLECLTIIENNRTSCVEFLENVTFNTN